MDMPTGHKPDSSPRRRLVLFGLLFVAFTAAGVWAVFEQFAGRSVAFDRRLLAPPVLAAAGALLALYFLADGLRLHYTLRALGHRIPAAAMGRLVFVNIFFSNVTPMATGGGIAQVWFLREHGVPVGRATAATTLRTVLATAVIFVATPLFLVFGASTDGHALLGRIAPVLAVLVTLYVLFFAVVVLRTRWLIAPLGGSLAGLRRVGLVGARRHRRMQFALRREVLRFARSFGAYLSGPPHLIALSVASTLLFLGCLFSFPALLVGGLGHDTAWLTTSGLALVTTFAMYFAPTPGAAGISEGVFGAFFTDILGPEQLVLVTLAWRFLTIHLGMLIGLVLLGRRLAVTARTQP
ncbi:MAG: flippase-like domain-containing protein [Azoarcus sp.]|nr:flippase-like domain-containing protein [Azoarcus sp.]